MDPDVRYQRRITTDMALTLRTDEEMERALSVLTSAEGASRQEIVRRAVLERALAAATPRGYAAARAA